MAVASSWVVRPILPKFIAPSARALTCTPVRPKVRYCMTLSSDTGWSVLAVRGLAVGPVLWHDGETEPCSANNTERCSV